MRVEFLISLPDSTRLFFLPVIHSAMTIFSKLTDTKNSAPTFIVVLMLTYALVPFLVNMFILDNKYFNQLAWITLLGCSGMAVGFRLPLLDKRFSSQARRFSVNDNVFHSFVWITFIIFIFITFITAKSIPLLTALSGASANELSQARGDFLKGRTGFEASLIYVITLLVSTLLPYSLIQLYIVKSKWRYVLATVFFLFSISFLQKALFLNLILPLLYFATQRLKINSVKIISIFCVCMGFLYFFTALSKGTDMAAEEEVPATVEDFFGSGYLPTDALQTLIWRGVAVPIFTAADTLLVFDRDLNSKPLLGATSSFISTIFSMENVNVEKMVFAHEFGGWNDIGNANAVFITDAYVNFGWVGVLTFGLFVGQSLRWYAKSKDEAFRAIWLLYCFNLYSASLIGIMLSNGFVLLFFFAIFMRLESQTLKKRS